jgi:hypothetical protein
MHAEGGLYAAAADSVTRPRIGLRLARLWRGCPRASVRKPGRLIRARKRSLYGSAGLDRVRLSMKVQVVRIILIIASKALLNGSLDREIARERERDRAVARPASNSPPAPMPRSLPVPRPMFLGVRRRCGALAVESERPGERVVFADVGGTAIGGSDRGVEFADGRCGAGPAAYYGRCDSGARRVARRPLRPNRLLVSFSVGRQGDTKSSEDEAGSAGGRVAQGAALSDLLDRTISLGLAQAIFSPV